MWVRSAGAAHPREARRANAHPTSHRQTVAGPPRGHPSRPARPVALPSRRSLPPARRRPGPSREAVDAPAGCRRRLSSRGDPDGLAASCRLPRAVTADRGSEAAAACRAVDLACGRGARLCVGHVRGLLLGGRGLRASIAMSPTGTRLPRPSACLIGPARRGWTRADRRRRTGQGRNAGTGVPVTGRSGSSVGELSRWRSGRAVVSPRSRRRAGRGRRGLRRGTAGAGRRPG